MQTLSCHAYSLKLSSVLIKVRFSRLTQILEKILSNQRISFLQEIPHVHEKTSNKLFAKIIPKYSH